MEDVDLNSFEFELQGGEWQECVFDADHHIGTTRRSVAVDKGVVNRNCRLHSVVNLSSVAALYCRPEVIRIQHLQFLPWDYDSQIT